MNKEDINMAYIVSQEDEPSKEFAKAVKDALDYVKTNLSKHVDVAAMVEDIPLSEFEDFVMDDFDKRQFCIECDQMEEVKLRLMFEFEDMYHKGLNYPPYYKDVMGIIESFAMKFDDAFGVYCSKLGISPCDILGPGGDITMKELKRRQHEQHKSRS